MNLDFESFQSIIDNCVNLKELNLYGTNLTGLQLEYLANNLTIEIAKLSLQSEENLTDEHVKALVGRCKKLTALDLGDTNITDESLNSIIENLKPTLEELDISYTKIAREFKKTQHRMLGAIIDVDVPVHYITKLFELNSMTQLRNLICRPIEDEDIEKFRSELPEVCINQGCLEIANSDQVYEPMDGFWEMDARQLKLFQSLSNRKTYEQRQIISRTGTW